MKFITYIKESIERCEEETPLLAYMFSFTAGYMVGLLTRHYLL